MEKARWKDKVFAEEYAREAARAQFKKDSKPKPHPFYEWLPAIGMAVMMLIAFLNVDFIKNITFFPIPFTIGILIIFVAVAYFFFTKHKRVG